MSIFEQSKLQMRTILSISIDHGFLKITGVLNDSADPFTGTRGESKSLEEKKAPSLCRDPAMRVAY